MASVFLNDIARPSRDPAPASAAVPSAPSVGWAAASEGGRFGASRRRNWPMIAAIVALHLLVIAALTIADRHHHHRHHFRRLRVFELQPLPVQPPPPQRVAAPARHDVTRPPPPQITAPPTIVDLPSPAPVVQVAPPAPPAPPAPSAAAPAAVASEAAPPVSAPDGTARSLGNPAPTYPIEARRNHQQGTVRLRVLISPEGRVRDIAVAYSSGFDILDRAALEAVRKWRFLPGRQAGVAVEAEGFLSIPFRLT